MPNKLFLTLILVLPSFTGIGQSGLFAVTANEAGGTAWNKIRTVGNGQNAVLLDATLPATFLKAKTKQQITPLLNGVGADALPAASGVAALAYDAATNRLYFAPMFRDGGIRYIDLNTGTKQKLVTVMETAYNLVDRAKDGEGKNITRMAIGRGGIGYAISNDGNSFLRFATTSNSSVENLGMLVDAESNGAVSVHQQCTSWGGDIVAAATGDLYLFSMRQQVFKINPETRVATYLGAIKGPDANFSVNGAAVDEKGRVVLCSSIQPGVKWVIEHMHTLEATAENVPNWMNASDLASAYLLFAKNTKTPVAVKEVPNPQALVNIYPNPVASGVLTIACTNMVPGKYQLDLLTASGYSTASKTIQVAAKGQVEKVSTQHLSKGWYVLRISNAAYQETFTEKILIQ